MLFDLCRWSVIVKMVGGAFIIQAYGKKWHSPSFSWYMIRRAPPLLTDGDEFSNEDNSEWLPKDYTASLSRAHPKFLPELIQNMIAGISVYIGKKGWSKHYNWKEERASVMQSTLAACCLASREWNIIFTPVLYKNIILGGKNSLLTRSFLHRTFRHIQPTHTTLVKTITIEPAEDGSTANLLSICFSFNFPNLHKLIINLPEMDQASLHSNFAQNLRSLSRCCAIQIGRNYGDSISTQWESLHLWINFIRRSRLTPCSFDIASSPGGY